MKIHQTVCDVCGTPKKETNNWFKAWVVLEKPEELVRFVIGHHTTSLVGKDLCGQECAAKLLSQWMATGEIDSPALREAVTL